MSSTKLSELKKLRDSIEVCVNGDVSVFDDKPSVIICNHNCLKDIFYLLASLCIDDRIISLISSRLIYKKDLERQNLVNRYLYSMPVEAHGGPKYASMCLDGASRLLSAGEHLNIFPEGAYIEDKDHVYKGRTGASKILFSVRDNGMDANIIPVSIDVCSSSSDLDSYDLNSCDRVAVHVLDPIDYEDYYYDYKNTSDYSLKNSCLHKVIDDGMRAIADSLDREYVDSYIELFPKGNVMFENGEKIDTETANSEPYLSSYESSVNRRVRTLIR